MRYLIDEFAFECAISSGLAMLGLYLKYAPSRAQLCRWIADRAEVTAQTAEYRERRLKKVFPAPVEPPYIAPQKMDGFISRLVKRVEGLR